MDVWVIWILLPIMQAPEVICSHQKMTLVCNFSDSTVSRSTQSPHGASIRMTELQGSYKIICITPLDVIY